MDFELRQLKKQKREPIQDYLDVDDLKSFGLIFDDLLESFGVSLPFYDNKLDITVRDLGYVDLREENSLVNMLNKLSNKHILVCLKVRGMAILQSGGELFLYNCHPSQPSANAQYNGNDPAVIIRADTKQQLSQIILQYGHTAQDRNVKVSFFALEHLSN